MANSNPRLALQIVMVILAALLFGAYILSGSRGISGVRPAPGAPAAGRSLQAQLEERVMAVADQARAYSRLSPDQLLKEIQSNPRQFLRILIVTGIGLFYTGVAAAGLFLLIWAGLRWRRGDVVLARQEGPTPQWRVWDAVVALAFLLLVSTAIGALFRPDNPYRVPLGSVPAQYLACLYAARLVRERAGQSVRALGLRAHQWARNILRGVLGYAAVYPIFIVLALLGQYAARLMGEKFAGNPAAEFLFWTESIPAALLIIVSAGLLVPPAEEFLFRGVLYGALRQRLGVAWGIVASAAIFAVFHLNVYHFPAIFGLGVVLAFLYERTRTLVAPVVVHALFNTVNVVTIFLLSRI